MDDEKVQRVIDNIIEQEMRGCTACGSQVDLVFCEGVESYVTGRSNGLLCYSCRKEWLFTDEGFLDEEQLEELFMLSAFEDDEEE